MKLIVTKWQTLLKFLHRTRICYSPCIFGWVTLFIKSIKYR